MPDPQWVEDTITPSSNWIEDTPPPPQQPEEQSTADWWIEQGLRTAPPVIGGFLGGLAGIPALGIGAIGGGMAGGAAGAAVGDVLGNWYSGKETNPYELGVTTLAGAAPPIFGPAKFAGSGLGAIARYAGGSALRGAAEGAIVSGVSTPFQTMAEGGDPFELSLGDYGRNMGAGAAFGTVVGGGMGAIHGAHLNAPHVPTEAAPPPPTGGGEAPSDWLPFGELPPDARPPVVHPEYTQQPLDFNAPLQGELPFGGYRGESGKFTTTGPGYKGPVHPALAEPLQQSLPMEFPPPPPPDDGGGSGGGGTISIAGLGDATPPPTPTGEQVVTIRTPDAATIAMYRAQGYVPVPGLRSPDGYPQMVRGDVAPLYVTGDRRASAMPVEPVSRPEVPGAIGQDQVAAGDEVPIPNEKVTASLIQNMEANGYVVLGKDSVRTIFKKFVSGDRAEFDPQQMWENLKRLLGRDPTAEEVDAAQAREVQPGEQTGRVAPFTQPQAPQEAPPSMPDLVTRANGLVDQAQANSQRITRAIEWTNAKAQELGINPDDFNSPAELFQHLKDMGVEAPSFDVPTPSLTGPEYGAIPPQMDVPPDAGGLDVAPLRQQAIMDPRMAARVEAGGPRSFDFTQAPNQQGQMELPWSRGEQPLPVDADARARELQAAADRFKRPQGEMPQQQNMLDLMADHELVTYLGLEDGKPPEATDILQHAATVKAAKEIGFGDRVKTIAKDFLTDESGTFDGDEAIRRISALNDRMRQAISGEPTPTPEEAKARQRQNDITEVSNNNDLAMARHIATFWDERTQTKGSMTPDERAHASQMSRVADRRLHDLEARADPTDPDNGPYEVFDSVNGYVVARVHSEEAAQDFIDGHHEGHRLDYEDTRQRLPQVYAGGEAPVDLHSTNIMNSERQGEAPLPTVDERPFNELSSAWNTVSRRYADVGDFARSAHADRMAHIVENHRRAAIFGEPTPSEPLPNAPDLSQLPPTRDQLRAATGVLNPPIEFGLQDPKTLGEINITRAQLNRLRGTNADSVARAEETRAQRKERVKQNRLRKEAGLPDYGSNRVWDNWGRQYLDAVPDGPPGLFIEDKTASSYSKEYHIIYRGPDGKVVAVAHVREKPDGARVVPTLAADRTKGYLYAKGVKQVLQAVLRMNAGEASGIISEHTANLIAQAARFIKEDAGSYQIGKITEALLKIKNDILGGKPLGSRKITSVEDGAKLMDDMAGGKTGLPWLISKIKDSKFISDERGAVSIPSWQGIKEATGWGQGATKGGTHKPDEFNWVKEALAVPNNATTMLDLSAPGRQGISMVLTPEFWKAGAAMFGSLHYDTFKAIDANLRSKPIMVSKIDLNTGKKIPSFGEQIGIKLFSPASESVGPRAEMTASRWLEMGIGNGPLAKTWRNTAGIPIRASNRAYITFLNHLNVNRTEKLLNLARDMSVRGLDTGRTAMPGVMGGVQLPGGGNIGFTQKVTPTEAMNLNPYHNLVLAKEIADFVNTATGHGPLKTHVLPFKQAEVSLEAAAGKLGYVLFSPGLLASRIRMMNPSTYIMASPYVRKQYLKAALSTAAAWYVSTELMKKAAGPEAEVGNDPTSADFGKVRLGDARLDLGGGFLQFATAYGRLYMGGSTSSSSGQFHRFGSGYQAQTQEDMMQRFFVNKLNPTAKFAYDVATASEYNPFHVGDRTIQLFVPLFHQDLMEIAKENPSLLPTFGTAAMFGGGSQIYSKGESVSKFIDPENDWNVTGGGVRDLMPWNWGNEQGQQPRTFPWSEQE